MSPPAVIRDLFSEGKQIDRPIEKVIDYYRSDEEQLAREVAEYEVTDQVEERLRQFLEAYRDGVSGSNVTQTGIWVSGFYGSGKSSFTKYLGFALDAGRTVGGQPFRDLFKQRLRGNDVKSLLTSVAQSYPAAVVFLDLGSEQIADTATATVTRVLYSKVLQWAGFSRDPKIAALEFVLDEYGKFDEFKAAYDREFPDKGGWLSIHHTPLLAIPRADRLLPAILPDDYPKVGDFRTLRFREESSVEELVKRMLRIARRRRDCEHVVFMIDEAGQYVAARSELILNLDGLARSVKDIGEGKAWIVATGQQTLSEVVERAMYNSEELGKLRDRFPIDVHLDPSDIREITYRRLLTKSESGSETLRDLFGTEGARTAQYTKLEGWSHYSGQLNANEFTQLYPFLPQHFEILLRLIRGLARTTGGLGLRSAIRVVQDLLVDATHVLPAGVTPIASRAMGTLVCVDDFYDSLKIDIQRQFPFIVAGVDNVCARYADNELACRVAKAVGVLQVIEDFPKSAENIAALLYRRLSDPANVGDVREVLDELSGSKETGIVHDPQSKGFIYLSAGVRPLQDKRNRHKPSGAELNRLRSDLLREIFDPLPAVMLERTRKVEAGLLWQRGRIAGDRADLHLRFEPCTAADRADLRTSFKAKTQGDNEFRNTIVCLVTLPDELQEQLEEVRQSEYIVQSTNESTADKDVARFIRSERARAQQARERSMKLIRAALEDDAELIVDGVAQAVKERSPTVRRAVELVLEDAAGALFSRFRLAPVAAKTDQAAKFLGVDRLDRVQHDTHDPLRLVSKQSGKYVIDVNQTEVLRTALADLLTCCEHQGGRVHGHVAMDLFKGPPYGWRLDTTRYILAALFRAGAIKLHTADGILTTNGPKAIEAFKSNQAFRRVGISPRDDTPSLEDLDLAAQRLTELSGGEDVMPLEEAIADAVRRFIPPLQEEVAAVPDQLAILELAEDAVERARSLVAVCTDLLREDASHAYQLLAGDECSVAEDALWARGVAARLADGGVEIIKRVRDVRSAVMRLSQVSPERAARLMTDEDRATVSESLRSVAFHQRLADVATTTDRVVGRAVEEYRALIDELSHAVEGAKKTLQEHPYWSALNNDDRESLASTLQEFTLSSETTSERALDDLHTGVFRLNSVPALVARLQKQFLAQPPEPEPGPDEPSSRRKSMPMKDLPRPRSAVLASEEDVDDWLRLVKEALLDILADPDTDSVEVQA